MEFTGPQNLTTLSLVWGSFQGPVKGSRRVHKAFGFGVGASGL